MKKFICLIGLAGVDKSENATAVLWGRYFNIMLMAAVVWLIFQWHLEFTNNLSFEDAWMGNFIVWVFFITETTLLYMLVHDKKRYLKHNWMNIFIILSGIPFLLIDYGPFISVLRAMRLLFIMGLLIPWLTLSFRFLTDNRLDTTIFTSVVILILAGVFIVELDPNINTIKDGIWWAWVTISTVGYGDVVPTSTVGRIFGGILILIGMGIFSVITANYAAILIQKEKRERWITIVEKLESLERQNEKLQQQIEHFMESDPLVTRRKNALDKIINEKSPP